MSCEIIIDNSPGYFVAGGSIEGRVVCSFSEQRYIKGVTLVLKGKEHTDWCEGSGKNRRHYKGDNVFLQSEVQLEDEGNIDPGNYEYPFKYILASNIPSTYMEDKHYIMYSIKAVVDISLYPDYVSKLTFTVISPIDLNIQRFVNTNPAQFQSEKILLFWCCASGPITLNLYMNKQAYVVGETIKFNLHCSNLSNQNVIEMRAVLLKVLKVTANGFLQAGHSKTFETIIALSTQSGVGAHGERVYEFEIPISPHLVLPGFTSSTLFEMWFTLKVIAVLPTFYRNCEVGCAITLGHIPVRAAQGLQMSRSGVVPLPEPQPGPSGIVPYSDNFNYPSTSTNEEDYLLRRGPKD